MVVADQRHLDSPFMSLRPDPDCGRSGNGIKSGLTSPANGKQFKGVSSNDLGYSNGYSNPDSNGFFANGKSNGNYAESNGGLSSPRSLFSRRESNWGDTDDEFLRLDKPQQDLLLLHGPRQKYQLQKGNDLPQLQSDDEILVQVLAIGLNPVDWKGNDYDFGQPSYPWVNGRDFAGIVVKAPRRPSRVQQGDVVMGASTDYRDIRKAAYQEYLVTTDYNVSRIPNGLSVKEGAAVGVAFLAGVIGLGVCFGLDFSSVRKGPRGPDLLRDLRRLDPREVPQDIRDEIYGGISYNERPQPGEWIAVWGANGVTGQFIVQLCKLAGLKVACVADLAKGSQSLTELGADFMVDKYDSGRAVEIIRAVTGGNLRFGIDVVGKETASFLQKALRQEDNGPKSHLLGLSGMPKQTAIGVVHHQVPLKIFHEAPNTGEAISRWLEQLFVAQALKAPQVSVAAGGLNGVNEALDQLRSGQVSGRRIVVPVGGGGDGDGQKEEKMEGPGGTGGLYGTGDKNDMSYHDNINSDPNRISFAYWVPNVSGGLVISKIPQRTHWDLKSNQRYAQKAEKWGFEYALSQIRFMAGYGAESQHEPVSISHAMLAATERIKLIIALLPGPWKPSVAAKMVASIDCYTEGRVCVNVVSGWFKAEFTSIGEHWLDHGERYRRSNEFIQCLKGIWTQESFTFRGDFYQFHDYPLKPKPLDLPGRPHPPIFQGGNSDDAKNNAATVSDYYFMNGNTLEGFQAQIGDVKERAAKNDHKIGFAINAFIICRDTEAEAWEALAEIQGKADPEAVEGFRQQVQNAGASTGNNSGMWANSSFKDLIQYNDGFKTRLIGTADQIAERIMLLKALGASILLTAFLHYEDEIEQFGREIIPRVRKLEQEGRGVDEEYEISQTGHIYSDAKAEDSNQAKVYTKHGWAKGQASK